MVVTCDMQLNHKGLKDDFKDLMLVYALRANHMILGSLLMWWEPTGLHTKMIQDWNSCNIIINFRWTIISN